MLRFSLVAVTAAKKLADAAWKAVSHGKDKVVVSDGLSSSANDNEYVTESFVNCSNSGILVKYKILVRCADTEIYAHTFVVKAAKSSILATEKSGMCVRMGEGAGSHTYVKEIKFRK